MREEEGEEESKCFARWDWEEQLPSPHELMPLSQALISPDLALAFGIPSSASSSSSTAPRFPDRGLLHGADASDLDPAAGGGGGEEEPPRTLKRPRLVWTPQLHKRFVDAVAHLGIKNAVPKTIMQLMGVEGLTRENVASHLQKYRLYLKRIQMQGGLNAAASQSPAANPYHGRAPMETCLPYMPLAMLQQHHKHTESVEQQPYYHQPHLGYFGGGGPRFMNRAVQQQQQQQQPEGHRAAELAPGIGFVPASPQFVTPFVNNPEWSRKGEDGTGGGSRRKELTLFPTGED